MLLEHHHGGRAPSRTYGTLATRPLTIKASGQVYVYGIHVKANASRTVTFQDKDGNPYFEVRTNIVGIMEYTIPVPWVANNGLLVTTTLDDSNAEITVFHKSVIS